MALVLVVDDEPDVRTVVRLDLELDGHDVIDAADGSAALALLEDDELPDVVVLDVMMPGIDGWDVLRTIKSHPDAAVAAIPVVMLTARVSDMDRIQGGIEGAVSYLTKPFTADELLDAVDRAVSGEPEIVQRTRAQHAALADLARIERGGPSAQAAPTTGRARVHLTRLERRGRAAEPAPAHGPVRKPEPERVDGLSAKQLELLRTIGETATVRAAADQLHMSRSNVYAGLRRITRKLDLASIDEVIALARSGHFVEHG